MKPVLKAPGIEHLKLGCSELLSSFVFKFNLRRHIKGGDWDKRRGEWQARCNRKYLGYHTTVGQSKLTL